MFYCLVTSGVLNNNGPFYVNVNFFFRFYNDQNCELSPETEDSLFDEVSFFSLMIVKLFSSQDYCYCCVLRSINLITSLYLFSVEW